MQLEKVLAFNGRTLFGYNILLLILQIKKQHCFPYKSTTNRSFHMKAHVLKHTLCEPNDITVLSPVNQIVCAKSTSCVPGLR